MRSFVTLCFILAAFISISSALTCGYIEVADKAAVYQVCDFTHNVSTFTNLTYGKNTNFTLQVSLGDNVVPDCNGSTSNLVFATLTNNTGKTPTCIEVAAGDALSVEALSSDDPTAGLYIPFTTLNNFNVVFQLSCQKDGIHKVEFDSASISGNFINVFVQSSNSCPNTYLSKLAFFFNKYPLVFTIIFVLIGAFICFFGLNMLKYTIFLIGAVGGTVITSTIFLSFVDFDTPKWTYWVIFGVCILIGIVVGWVAVKIEALGFIVLGAVLGVVGGNILFVGVIAPLGGKTVVYYLTLVVCGIVGAGLAYKFWKSFVIIATGILGSFMIVKAIGGAIGNFPSADTFAEGFQFTPIIYAYLFAILVLSVAGIYVQHKRKIVSEIEEDQDVHGYQRVMAGYNA